MASVQEVAKAEQAYAETLKRPPPKSNVELF
jgi:chemotaxis protein CheD